MSDDLIWMELFCGLAGILLGILLYQGYLFFSLKSVRTLEQEIFDQAEKRAQKILDQATMTRQTIEKEGEQKVASLLQQERKRAERAEAKRAEKEAALDQKQKAMDRRLAEIDCQKNTLQEQLQSLQVQEKELEQKHGQLDARCYELAGMTLAEAKEKLFQEATCAISRDVVAMQHRITEKAKEEAERNASKIIATCVQRLAVACSSTLTVSSVNVPNDEMKGRIIGREGRNVRAFEQATGVSLLIDDTPGAIIITGFDPIRRQIAKIALTRLMQTGRIHSASIEEAVQQAQQTLDKQLKEFGQDAAIRVGVLDLQEELIFLLGKLKFRYSLGQNVLDHSLEVAHLMGLMAGELGLDVSRAKRIGLLHDIGKAASLDAEGSHALIGRDLAMQWGESLEVANGIGCHHGEIEAITLEGELCGAADAISASREGARSERWEEYIKRMKNLETCALSFPGVDKAFVLQAGREIRIFVHPREVEEEKLPFLAETLKKALEREIRAPGYTRLTIVRESKLTCYV